MLKIIRNVILCGVVLCPVVIQAQSSQGFEKVTGLKVYRKYITARKDSFIMKVAHKKTGSWQWTVQPQGKQVIFNDVSILDGKVREDAEVILQAASLEMTQMNMVLKSAKSTLKAKVKAKGIHLWAKYALTQGDKERQQTIDTTLHHHWLARPTLFGLLPFADFKPSYSRRFFVFGLTSGKFTLMKLEVLGTTKVTVPAGTFDTYKVALKVVKGSGVSNILYLRKKLPHFIIKVDVEGSGMTIEKVE
ncbi:DUF3108 domain-containing protein [Microscilla marina]|uniref:DUF3108 domain-containing protein n=1 Tax=Microscilla marina ATCC 23134 TaxID=313606 RepID=A1ZCF4_MICM2|nr:hypothetical protein [Microscilla marina]EAY31956.1 hypothetical protein M23134_01985 [Microscilla marina ATCC 23134]